MFAGRSTASRAVGDSGINTAIGMTNSSRERGIRPLENPDDACPVCKTDRYLNPSMQLKIGSCFHSMCESCIERLFGHGPAPCPFCQITLRKALFVLQTFEDIGVEREVQVRRRVLKVFNARQTDFATAREYDDYLEEVEDIIFNLVNGVDVVETEERIKKYELQHQAAIERNRSIMELTERKLAYQREQEAKAKKQQQEAYLKELADEERLRNEARQSMIDELANASSGRSASDIVHRAMMVQRQSAAAARQQSHLADSTSMPDWMIFQQAEHDRLLGLSGNATDSAASAAAAAAAQAALEAFDPLGREIPEPSYPYNETFAYADPAADALLKEPGFIAGGLTVNSMRRRALESAFAGLTVKPL
ncbi:CDK-activating kinase assembly factor [Ramicandelaber brevisporus]|nr:CDK-activating kinase assembly factor [Ramicandelaber brevisporus]